jgi:hypothetical protein
VHSRKQILFILAPDFYLSNPRRRKRDMNVVSLHKLR